MTINSQPSLTIIVLTYNSEHIVKRCLDNLNFEKYKVVVVDNASKDGTVELVRKNFPKAEIIQLEKNGGYGRGNNVALRQVKTEFALVLNPDAVIFEKDIEIVLDEMRANQKVAIAGPIMFERDPIKLTQEMIDSAKTKIEKDLQRLETCITRK